MLKKCIYCLELKEEALFNREHVVPQSMGKFENNLVLSCVCKACNDFFSASLDGILARDSFEAVLRFEHGLKSISRFSELNGKRVTLTVSRNGGDWAGALIELTERDGEKFAKPMTQIGFLNKTTGQYEFLPYEKLQDVSFAKNFDLQSNNFKMLASSDDELEKLRDLLVKAGWNPQIHGELPAPINEGMSIDIDISCIIDRMLERAFAKIGFNYFAAIVKSKDLFELLGHNDVDVIRNFIRYDTEAERDRIIITAEPILQTDTRNQRQTDTHLIVLDWLFYTNGRKDLRVRISLFNRLTYQVTLIRNYPIRPLPEMIVSGHQFDFTSSPARCLPLSITSL
jgi:hypothetical protein